MSKIENDLRVPANFKRTAEAYDAGSPKNHVKQFGPFQNPQTVYLCELLNIDDPIEMILGKSQRSFDEIHTKLKNDSTNIGIDDRNSSDNSDDTFINDTVIEEKLPYKDLKKNSPALSISKPKNETQDLFFMDRDPWPNDSGLLKRHKEDNSSNCEHVACTTESTITQMDDKIRINNQNRMKRRNTSMPI